MLKLFQRHINGTNLEENKHLTQDLPIEEATVPKLLYFPLSMHIGAPAEPVVKIGDQVKIGSLLAEDGDHVSAAIISSVSGQVVNIGNYTTVNGKEKCIVVENDYQETCEDPIIEPGNAHQLSAEEKIEAIRKAGIVGMGGAGFPSAVKLAPGEEIDRILINGAECEPFSTSDYRIMIEHADEIVKGAQFVQEMFPGSQVFIGIEHQHQACVDAMTQACQDYDHINVHVLDHLYPQGAEKVLIREITGREVPSGGLPADVGCIVKNVGTCLATYHCLQHGRPLISRITTLTGFPVSQPKNLRVRIGTRINQLFEDCGGIVSQPGKVLHGGPMMGKAIDSGCIPVTKATSVITVLTPDQAEIGQRYDCIRCSECINVCPINLQPIQISNAYERGDIDLAEELGAMECFECGNCSYICPSNIPLLDNIRKAKTAIQEKNKD